MHANKVRTRHSLDAWDSVSPKGQIFASLAVLVPVALSGLVLVALAPGLWWILTTYFWVSFPALGLLRRGLAGLFGSPAASSRSIGKEREVLEALHEHGDLTPARAAMETSLTVAEAEGVLEGLARDGHLEVRARGGTLSYALWEAHDRSEARGEIRGSSGEPGLKLLEPGADGTRKSLERSGT
jgi:hypothetical protein